MRFFRRIAGILGLGKDEGGHEEAEGDSDDARNRVNVEPIPGPRKGFGVPVKVAVERPTLGPIVVPCNGDGGVQGLKWYARRLRTDEDGDVADEFLDQVKRDPSLSLENHQQQQMPSFQAKRNTRPAKIQCQVMSPNGKFQQCVESQGKLRWV